MSDLPVRFYLTGVELALRLTKTVSLLESPPVPLPEGVACAGYRLRSVLQSLGTLDDRAHPAVWNILQVPGGGTISVPVAPGAQPRTFVGTPSLQWQGDVLTCRVETPASYKFCIRAEHSCGLLLWHREQGDRAELIVRRFHVGDGSQYYDMAFDDMTDRGYATQVYVDDGALGGFGELEYHTPALDAAEGRTEVDDSSDVWGLAGPRESVLDCYERLIAGNLR